MQSPLLSNPKSILGYDGPLFPLQTPKSHRRRFAVVAAARQQPKHHLSHCPALHTTDFSIKTETESLRTFCCNLVDAARKPLSLLLFCMAVGFVAVPGGRIKAVAAVVAREEVRSKRGVEFKDHEFSGYTRKLLNVVSRLLRRIEEAKAGKEDMDSVRRELREVKMKKKEIQDKILAKLDSEISELKNEKDGLVKKAGKVRESASAIKDELDELLSDEADGDEVKVSIETLERSLSDAEKEYDMLWEKVGEIDDKMLRRETMTFSIAIRELSFIEKECEALVQKVERELKERTYSNVHKGFSSRLSKHDIQKGLEAAKDNYWEQILLPKALKSEDPEIFAESSTQTFASNIRRVLNESQLMQINLESQIRQKLRKFGDEKRFVALTPENEIAKGFPEVELKWLFGQKEVVVPKAVRLHLFHGWKKWREEAKSNMKRELLENLDHGRQYIEQRQNRILLDRERLMTKTWYNDERGRWEMDPVAVPYAVAKSLVENARIRHDWAVMYVALKGDDKEYFVNLTEFDFLFEDYGGSDGLYVKMLACGVPTSVQAMWIPFSELNARQQIMLIARMLSYCMIGLWNYSTVSILRERFFSMAKDTTEDIMVMGGFSFIETLVPYQIRTRIGMAWPEELYQAVDTPWYLKWQSEVEMSHNTRKEESFSWHFQFLVRSIFFGYVLFHVLWFLKRKVPRLLGFGPYRRDPNLQKLRRVKQYFNYKLYRKIKKKKEGLDPIKSAFEKMKRVKNPPIRLQDFASVDSMREEINDIVTCLRNPTAFQEKGARAPRGVLIVGERGTGKTSLALAIAAEARVPMVELKAQQLEAGLWVGQSASNIRELFQTARDLAPVILFVEDFDVFAGVRGQFIHTNMQDHEAFINQLLVELDGFENQDGVVLMATTRNLKQIDEALKRPGRMDRVLHLQRPTQMEREKILKLSAKDTMDDELINFVDWKKVAEKTALLRPVELKVVPIALEGSAFRSKFLDTDELMCFCSWLATFSFAVPTWLRRTKFVKKISKAIVSHLGLTLTREDIESVVDLMEPYGQISNGIEFLSPPIDWTMATKFPHAVWVAGRALIAMLLPNFDVVDHVWLEPAAWEGIGCTKISKAKDEGSVNGNLETRSYLEKKLVFCFGSYIASQLLLPFGEENLLSSSELKQAQEVATRMVIQYGWGPDDSSAIYVTSKAVGILSMGNNHEFEMAEKVEKIYNLGYDKALEMIQKNRKVLEKIVEQLLEFENMTGEDLQSVLEEYGAIREQEPFFVTGYQYRELISGSSLDSGSSKAAMGLLGVAT